MDLLMSSRGEGWTGHNLMQDPLKESKRSRRQGYPHLLEHTAGDAHGEQSHVLVKHCRVHTVPLIIVQEGSKSTGTTQSCLLVHQGGFHYLRIEMGVESQRFC